MYAMTRSAVRISYSDLRFLEGSTFNPPASRIPFLSGFDSALYASSVPSRPQLAGLTRRKESQVLWFIVAEKTLYEMGKLGMLKMYFWNSLAHNVILQSCEPAWDAIGHGEHPAGRTVKNAICRSQYGTYFDGCTQQDDAHSVPLHRDGKAHQDMPDPARAIFRSIFQSKNRLSGRRRQSSDRVETTCHVSAAHCATFLAQMAGVYSMAIAAKSSACTAEATAWDGDDRDSVRVAARATAAAEDDCAEVKSSGKACHSYLAFGFYNDKISCSNQLFLVTTSALSNNVIMTAATYVFSKVQVQPASRITFLFGFDLYIELEYSGAVRKFCPSTTAAGRAHTQVRGHRGHCCIGTLAEKNETQVLWFIDAEKTLYETGKLGMLKVYMELLGPQRQPPVL
ncbi:hypothetical protein GGX14DRAFT_400770 [Mycena pura]|uniref:Uncharacterized protein n=1 Tax=Mycena pura TaxID=153505 RepID=A0AAD6V1G1_9AGAR|nr:hypothetical protein GGX14DRAFT_400770 [Mycena pura]